MWLHFWGLLVISVSLILQFSCQCIKWACSQSTCKIYILEISLEACKLVSPGSHWRYRRWQQRRLRCGRWSVFPLPSNGPSVPSLWIDRPKKKKKPIKSTPVSVPSFHVWISICAQWKVAAAATVKTWWLDIVAFNIFFLRSLSKPLKVQYPPPPRSRKRPGPVCTSSRCLGTGWEKWQTAWGSLGAEVLPPSPSHSGRLYHLLWSRSANNPLHLVWCLSRFCCVFDS